MYFYYFSPRPSLINEAVCGHWHLNLKERRKKIWRKWRTINSIFFQFLIFFEGILIGARFSKYCVLIKGTPTFTHFCENIKLIHSVYFTIFCCRWAHSDYLYVFSFFKYLLFFSESNLHTSIPSITDNLNFQLASMCRCRLIFLLLLMANIVPQYLLGGKI